MKGSMTDPLLTRKWRFFNFGGADLLLYKTDEGACRVCVESIASALLGSAGSILCFEVAFAIAEQLGTEIIFVNHPDYLDDSPSWTVTIEEVASYIFYLTERGREHHREGQELSVAEKSASRISAAIAQDKLNEAVEAYENPAAHLDRCLELSD